MTSRDSVEHQFRHQQGKLVAALLRRFGAQQLESAEDAVQFAMLQALDVWPRQGQPDSPQAWLFQVAYRHLVSQQRSTQQHFLASEDLPEQTVAPADVPLPGEMQDAMLSMMFVICQKSVPLESQLVFTLKSLCGFSIREISQRLFISDDNVYKRYNRAKHQLQSASLDPDTLSRQAMTERLPQVHKVIYLLFTEGYLSSNPQLTLRLDLCKEAIRLARMLSEHAIGACPSGYALLALMHLHLARMGSRYDANGLLLLLAEQNREAWDKSQISIGLHYLQKSGQGEQLSKYHLEASIAAEHCLAESFEKTRWQKIAQAYEMLNQLSPSPLYRLNQAVAVAEIDGPAAALNLLESMQTPTWLTKSYHWHAVKADLLFRNYQLSEAEKSAINALELCPSKTIQVALQRRFSSYQQSG